MMEETQPDAPRLHKVLEHVRELSRQRLFAEFSAGEPVQVWSQYSWLTVNSPEPGCTEVTLTERGVLSEEGTPCGTAGCFAGHAALMFGEAGSRFALGRHELDDGYCGPLVVLPDGTSLTVAQYAQGLLGLSSSQAETLFRATNSLTDLEDIVECLTGQPAAGREEGEEL